MFSSRQEIDLEDAVVQAEAVSRPRVEPVILKQGVLHNPEQKPVVWADRQTFHAAIGLTSRCVEQQLGVRGVARIVDLKLRGDVEAAQQAPEEVKLKNIRTVFIRDEEGSEEPDSNPLRVEPQAAAFVVRVKRSGRSDQSLTAFVPEQACV